MCGEKEMILGEMEVAKNKLESTSEELEKVRVERSIVHGYIGT